ncbi:MAG: type IV secretion system DNA-binding domain-containing protein [bacterium]|nr:type IV secretion system DNA-binding domain-containing protein [bacterium]
MELPEIPLNKELTYLGLSTYRDKNVLFGIKRKDRRQHVYLLGKSGTGKSVLMFNMIIQNIQNGDGVCVVDPHGELVEGVLSAIPLHRMKDVIYFNPADTDYHIGFNVLELVDAKYKHLVASGLMGIFTKIWANAWSARMEYILNNTILALLDTPGSTLLGIPRMLVDKDYRQKIISNLKDPVIKAFWVHEYEAWQDKFRNEAIAPIQNKVGQFLSTSIIRNVVGQSQSTINVFDIMNGGKIFLVNVSKGRVGEDNSGLLGGMIITKIQLAAMERVRIPEEIRRDFYLYVDEFQNFVTDAFAGILSEARKYRLNLTVAHQYTAQLISDKSSAVRDAIFGNVGTMIVFRVGADDAEFLESEFDPEFTPGDIVNLPNYKVYMKLMIDGVTSRPFSAKTLPQMVKSGNKKVEEEVIQSSRDLYCRPRAEVEQEINDWSGMSLGGNDNNPNSVERFKAECSICKKETMVPFKPSPGRAVYCRDCMEKVKTGQLKPVVDNTTNAIIYNDAAYYKPLADLGIEFESKEAGSGMGVKKAPEVKNFSNIGKSNAFSAIKKIFHGGGDRNAKPNVNANARPSPRLYEKPNIKLADKKENLGLREILNKTLSSVPVTPITLKPPAPTPPSTPPVAPVSLSELKKPEVKETTNQKKDLAATPEDMEKLKNIITAKSGTPQEAVVSAKVATPATPPQSFSTPTPTPPPTLIQAPETSQNPKIKEVPEDVLKKILE